MASLHVTPIEPSRVMGATIVGVTALQRLAVIGEVNEAGWFAISGKVSATAGALTENIRVTSDDRPLTKPMSSNGEFDLVLYVDVGSLAISAVAVDSQTYTITNFAATRVKRPWCNCEQPK